MDPVPTEPSPAAGLFSLAPQNCSSLRLTVTVPYGVHQRLLLQADQQGRSISNLVAFLLERSLARAAETEP